MTVIFSKKCEYGIQAVLYLVTTHENDAISAENIKKKLGIPKEFVSKILQSLTQHGIIISKKGKNGGFRLAKLASKIKLIDIVEAIDGLEVFESCILGFSNCGNSNPCPIHETWGKIRNETYRMLKTETLEELKEKVKKKIKSL